MAIAFGAMCLLVAISGPTDPVAALPADFALLRPVDERAETVLRERLPVWRATYPFARQALPLALPVVAADLPTQAARLERLRGLVGDAELLAVAPAAGAAGWEANHHPASLGVAPGTDVVPLTAETWASWLCTLPVAHLALQFDGLRREPTAAELGAWLDTVLAGLAGADQTVELWLPAMWLIVDADNPDTVAAAPISALTPARLAHIQRLVWLDVRRTALRRDPFQPATKEHLPLIGLAPLLTAAAERAGATPWWVDWVDAPLPAEAPPDSAYLSAAAAAGAGGVVVRGYLHTLERVDWRRRLLSVLTPPVAAETANSGTQPAT